MCRICSGSAAGILAIPPTSWMTSERSVSARTACAAWARSSSGSPGGEQRGAAGLEQRRVAVDVLEQLLGQRLLGGQIADQPVAPRRRTPPTAAARRGRRLSGRDRRPRRRRPPRAAPGGWGSCGTACRSRPRRGARSPPARRSSRARRRPRGRRPGPCRSCAGRQRAWAGRASGLGTGSDVVGDSMAHASS